MTDAQNGMYFREWALARRTLRKQGLAPADCDARRHQVHLEELGADKSHLEFTEDDFDAVLAGFWKISYPHDLARQLRQLNMRKTRLLYKIDQMLGRIGKDRRFAEGVLEQIDYGIDPNSVDAFWQRERERKDHRRTLDQLNPDELKNVISALRSISRRSRRSDAGRMEIAEPITPVLQHSNSPF
jgi:hypothetical protein